MQYNAYVVYNNSVPSKVTGKFNTYGDFKKMSLVLKDRAKRALWNKFKDISPCPIDSQGYVKELTHNLLPGVNRSDFESELSTWKW
jgi:hypothetical protein